MGQDPRLCLLKAARELFGEYGFDGTSLRDIASKAKTNVAMIAYYFGGKDKLFKICLNEVAASHVEIINATLIPPKDGEDFKRQLIQLIRALTHSLDDRAPLIKLLLREIQNERNTKGARELLKIAKPFYEALEHFFEDAQKSGIIPERHSPALLTMIFLAALSYPIQSEQPIKVFAQLNVHDEKFRNEYTHHLVEIFCKGVLQ